MLEFLLKLADHIGMIGVVIILVAYYLLSVGRWAGESFRFQFLNFIGAWMILFSLYVHWNLSSVVIEIAWIIISVIGMWRAVLKFKVKK